MRVMAPLISGVVRWLKAEKRNPAAWPTCNWSMSCGETFASTASKSASGNDQHDRIGGADHTTDGMHRELMHDTVLRCPDLDVLELIFRRHLALDEFPDFHVDLAQLPRDFAAQVLIDLDNLQLGFGDLAARLRRRRERLRAFALEPHRFPFERR